MRQKIFYLQTFYNRLTVATKNNSGEIKSVKEGWQQILKKIEFPKNQFFCKIKLFITTVVVEVVLIVISDHFWSLFCLEAFSFFGAFLPKIDLSLQAGQLTSDVLSLEDVISQIYCHLFFDSWNVTLFILLLYKL